MKMENKSAKGKKFVRLVLSLSLLFLFLIFGKAFSSEVPTPPPPPWDTTPPSTPVVTDDGAATQDPTKLTFTITAKDDESGIAEYQYAIGTAANFESESPFTSTASSSVTHTGLNLKENETYYISVKAKNNASLTSETGRSDGITYKIRLSKITITSNPVSMLIGSTDKKAVTYTLINEGNLPVQLISEKVVYVLPAREQIELPAVMDISLPVGNSATLNREVALGQAILDEILGGTYTGAVTIKRIFRGIDENGEVEITHLLPVEVTRKPQEIYEVKSLTVDLPMKSVLKDTKLIATVGIQATGLGGQVSCDIWLNGVPWQTANVPAQGGNNLTYFDTPPLPTSQSGTYEVVVKTNSPNVYASSPVSYKVEESPAEISLKDFVLRPTQTVITPQEDMLVLKGEGDIDMLPFDVKTVKVQTEDFKVRDNKFVSGKIIYTPVSPAATAINGMNVKISSFEFTPDSSAANVTFAHPYLPQDNSFKLEIDKEGFKPDRKTAFEFPKPKTVEIGQMKMEFLKGNIYIKSPQNIIMTLFSKEKGSVALFPGLNVTVEGMRVEF